MFCLCCKWPLLMCLGGPLYEGDIEDCGDKLHVICPWHGYSFDVHTGKNELGIWVCKVSAMMTPHALNIHTVLTFHFAKETV